MFVFAVKLFFTPFLTLALSLTACQLNDDDSSLDAGVQGDTGETDSTFIAQNGPSDAPQWNLSDEALQVASWVLELPSVPIDENHFSVIGGLNFMGIEQATNRVREIGPADFYADTVAVDGAHQALQRRIDTFLPLLAAGGLTWLRDVQNLPWGMIEIEPGRYDFRLADHLVVGAQSQGLTYVGSVMPYADWDLSSRGDTDDVCEHFLEEDFFYLAHGGAMDRYVDLDAFIAFLSTTVERYDGDGTDDAPGLQSGIHYWQIHNEPEGVDCGGFRDDVSAFVELMRRSYEAVHAADPEAVVLNGGAGIPLWVEDAIHGGSFWSEFAELGGGETVDAIAVHYNDGKVDGGDIDEFEYQLNRMRELLGDKPIWLTEFGVMVEFGGRFFALPEVDAAAWYIRFYAAGLANGVERFFSDAASFITMEGEIRLTFFVNRMMEAMIGGFSEAVKLDDGQYRFTVDGFPVYVLWDGVPAEISGEVVTTDMYGHQLTLSVEDVIPSENSPLIVTLQ